MPRRSAHDGWWRSRRLALAAVAGLAGCSGDTPVAPPSVAPPPTTLAPATLADLTGAVTSTEGGRQIGCREDVHATVSLTNRSPSAVLVTGVRKSSGTRTQGCVPVDDFTYQVVPRLVAGGTTATVMSSALYTGGSGCCLEPARCGGTCVFVETYSVVNELGPVPAGSFEVDTWTVAESGGRTVTYLVESAKPFRLIRWFASDGEEASLLGSDRLAYWERNGPGGEKYLKKLRQ